MGESVVISAKVNKLGSSIEERSVVGSLAIIIAIGKLVDWIIHHFPN